MSSSGVVLLCDIQRFTIQRCMIHGTYIMQRKIWNDLALSRLWGRLWVVSKVESSVRERDSPFEVYPAGKLQ